MAIFETFNIEASDLRYKKVVDRFEAYFAGR